MLRPQFPPIAEDDPDNDRNQAALPSFQVFLARSGLISFNDLPQQSLLPLPPIAPLIGSVPRPAAASIPPVADKIFDELTPVERESYKILGELFLIKGFTEVHRDDLMRALDCQSNIKLSPQQTRRVIEDLTLKRLIQSLRFGIRVKKMMKITPGLQQHIESVRSGLTVSQGPVVPVLPLRARVVKKKIRFCETVFEKKSDGNPKAKRYTMN